jgi:hypothetical protein
VDPPLVDKHAPNSNHPCAVQQTQPPAGWLLQSVEDLASVYCAWAEMELRHEEYDKALQVMQHAVTEPSQAIQRRRQAEAQGRALAGLKGGREQQEMQAAIPVQVRKEGGEEERWLVRWLVGWLVD